MWNNALSELWRRRTIYLPRTRVRSHAAHLAPRTRQTYASTYDRHIAPRLGDVPLRKIDPGVGQDGQDRRVAIAGRSAHRA
jgi:hypothetical protein